MSEKRPLSQYLIVGAIFVLFFAVIAGTLVPVLLGMMIAMIIWPIYRWHLRVLRNRKHIAAVISLLLLIVCVVLPLTLVTISMVEDVTQLAGSVSNSMLTQDSDAHKEGLLKYPIVQFAYNKLNSWIGISEETFLNRSREILVSILSVATTITGDIVKSVPGTIVSITFFLLAFYFGLTDGPRLVGFLHENLPFSKSEMDTLFRTVESICKGVMLGALTAGIVQGFIIGLGYWIFGIPQPFLFGTLTVILSFIPLFGTLPTALGGVIYLLIQHRVGAAIGLGLMFLAASISDNIVKPWVLKGRSELHPLLGLISVLGGLKVFGFAGIFLGPTIVALTINLLELRRKRQEASAVKVKESGSN